MIYMSSEQGLFLGSQAAAENEDLLKEIRIKYVVQALEYPSKRRFEGVYYHFVQINDLESENILQFLPNS